MFANKPVDLEAPPGGLKQRGLAVAPTSLRHMMEKNAAGRPIIRWRRLRPATAASLKDDCGKRSNGTTNALRKNHQSSGPSTTDARQHQHPLFRFLQEECPEDVLPKILAFAGPQKAAILNRTNQHWRKIMQSETTWKIMCQDLYKWTQGDEEPQSWKEFYCSSPCVPVDFPTVEAAMRLTNASPLSSSRRKEMPRQIRSLRILLRPGNYHLHEGIHIHAAPGVTVTMESIALPSTCRWYRSSAPTPPAKEEPVERPLPIRPPPVRSLFQILRCATRNDFAGARMAMNATTGLNRSSSNAMEEPTEHSSVSEEESSSHYQEGAYGEEESVKEYPIVAVVPPSRAMLVLRTRRNNEPMFRIRQGQINLVGVDISHESYGIDIWNGNAAVQIQPPPQDQEDPAPLPAALQPRASLINCRVRSKSGRGVVNIDGGHVDVNRCFIAGCAATGLYVGGPGSSATVEYTDIYSNGRGNPRRRGIARGHSGVYLEQGDCSMDHCLVAGNTLTGISAVSYEKAFLTLTNSTIAQNGTHQMELPPVGTTARSRSVIDNNDLQATELEGQSGLWQSV